MVQSIIIKMQLCDISKLHNKSVMLIMWSAAIPKVTLKCYNPHVTFHPVTMETEPYSINRWHLGKKNEKRKRRWQEVMVVEIRCRIHLYVSKVFFSLYFLLGEFQVEIHKLNVQRMINRTTASNMKLFNSTYCGRMITSFLTS